MCVRSGLDGDRCRPKLDVVAAVEPEPVPGHPHMTAPPTKATTAPRDAHCSVAAAKHHHGEKGVIQQRPQNGRPAVVRAHGKLRRVSMQPHARENRFGAHVRGFQGLAQRRCVRTGRGPRRHGEEERVLVAGKDQASKAVAA